MVGHAGSSAGSYLADPTSPIPSHCASIVVTSTVRVKIQHTCAELLGNHFSFISLHGKQREKRIKRGSIVGGMVRHITY